MTEIIAEFGSSITVDLNRCSSGDKIYLIILDSQKHVLYSWCKAAAESGATHVKIQLFKAEHFPITEQESKRPLEFPRELVPLFVETAHHYGLKAGASVFDKEAVELAAQHCDFIKLACREMNNAELQVTAMSLSGAKKIYRSIDEYFWYGGGDQGGRITHLYAIQKYPAPIFESICRLLMWVNHARRTGGNSWGWSSHTRGWLDCWLAAKLGASVIEKHLAMSPSDIEAGHSLLPGEFAKMAREING